MRISDWSSDVCSSDLFDLVFTDVVMPGMTGLELASKLKQQNPRLPIILTTGYSDRIVSAGSEGYPVLPKPYRLETLAATLDKVQTGRWSCRERVCQYVSILVCRGT